MKRKLLFVVLGITLVLTNLALAHEGADEFAHHSMMEDTYGMMSGVYGYGGMFFVGLISLLIIVILVLLVIWLIKQIQKK